MDEFNRRFNCEEFTPGIDSSAENSKLLNIISLFDGNYFTVMDSGKDTLFRKACDFAQTVVKEQVRLDYSDSLWFAQAQCKGKLNGKSVSFSLYLNVRHRGNGRYKWVISKAEGKIFDLDPADTTSNIMITPNSHNVNFIVLSDITSPLNCKNITRFGQDNLDLDQTSIFNYLVYHGNLTIEYVESLEFKFLQVPGYIFSVKEFVRDTFNSGWLIYNLEKVDNQARLQLMDNKY